MRNVLSLALLLAVPAAAQQASAPTPYQRAIAAGYKALTLCSAVFTARASGVTRTRESVEANELRGTYPEYDGLIAAIPAVIDEQNDRVTAAYDASMPPRVAVARSSGDCTILPIGTRPESLERRLRIDPGPFRRAAFGNADESRGIRSPSLRGLVAEAFDGPRYGVGSRTTAIVIMRDGHVIAERYAPGFTSRTPQRTWSVAKSMAGTLAGVTERLRRINLGKPAPVAEWQTPGDPRRAITTDQLLRMVSGLHSDTAGNRTDAIYFGGTAVSEQAPFWPLEAPPGTRFRYANNDILIAVRAIASSYPKGQFTPSLLLFARIGMDDTYAETDWRGDYVLSSQVWSSARDLARLGQLWLQDGVWRGERLLPEGWVADSIKPSGPQPADGPGYGRTLWLFGPKQGLPEGSYAAQGNRGQYVMVIPSERLVVVRRGEDPGPARFDIARFTADVIGTLK